MALDPAINFGKVEVSTGYDDAATTVVLAASEGAKLPDPATAGAFNVVWFNWTDYRDPADDANREIVRVTARSTDTLTVTRAQEGTAASTKNTASKVYKMILAPTKKMIDDIGTEIDARVAKATYDANTILAATSDNTPVALTVGEQTVVGRVTSGNIAAIAIDADLSSVSGSDDTIPSAKATKAYVDSLARYANLNAPEGFLINGKIVPSVASNNLTVAIKGLDGNNPSATNPVYCRMGDTVRSITAALGITHSAGINWFNAGSAELATKEIDYFVYLMYSTVSNSVALTIARIPHATVMSDFSGTLSNEKYTDLAFAGNSNATDVCVNIGRCAATLSAGAGYTWTIPALTTTNLIQRPIYETRLLSLTPVFTGFSSNPASDTMFYKLIGTRCFFTHCAGPAGTSNATTFTVQLPFIVSKRISGASRIQDNSGTFTMVGMFFHTGGNNDLNYYPNAASGNWTASGSKSADANFSYEI